MVVILSVTAVWWHLFRWIFHYMIAQTHLKHNMTASVIQIVSRNSIILKCFVIAVLNSPQHTEVTVHFCWKINWWPLLRNLWWWTKPSEWSNCSFPEHIFIGVIFTLFYHCLQGNSWKWICTQSSTTSASKAPYKTSSSGSYLDSVSVAMLRGRS